MICCRLDENGYLFIKCPACNMIHLVPAKAWKWNGSFEKPTLDPSIKLTWDWGEEHIGKICHFHIIDGVIIFHDDCTHTLRGPHQLPEYDTF